MCVIMVIFFKGLFFHRNVQLRETCFFFYNKKQPSNGRYFSCVFQFMVHTSSYQETLKRTHFTLQDITRITAEEGNYSHNSYGEEWGEGVGGENEKPNDDDEAVVTAIVNYNFTAVNKKGGGRGEKHTHRDTEWVLLITGGYRPSCYQPLPRSCRQITTTVVAP